MKPQSPNRILTPLGVGIALSLLGDQTLYTVLPAPEISAQAGVSLAMVGILLGVNRLTRIGSNGLAGVLYDRLPRRGLMIAAMSIGAVSTMCYAVAAGGELLILGRVLWGIAWSGIWVGASTIALDISCAENRGRITGRLQMWFFFGAAISSLAGGFFTDVFGYRSGLWVSALLTALAVLLWLVFLPETRPGPKSPLTLSEGSRSELSFPWREALKAAVPYFALRLVFAGVLAATSILWLSQFVEGGLSLPGITVPLATLTGGFVALRVLVGMFSAPMAGSVSDRIGRRWAIIAIALLVGTGGLLLMGLPVVILAIVGAFSATVAAGSVQGLVPAIVGDRVGGAQQSRALSIVFIIGDLGSALGPPLGLWLVPLLGLGSVYRLCALLFFLVGMFAVWFALIESRVLSKAPQLHSPPAR